MVIMPRIDPIQLLNCLSVLLSPNGGIKSGDEVQRLARGWLLVHIWLTESIVAKNWPLVKELLELLLLCPVDIERLKTNNCPKLVKELSKDGNQFVVRALASKLVEQWLKIVKGEQVVPVKSSELVKIVSEASNETEANGVVKTEKSDTKLTENDIKQEIEDFPKEEKDDNDTITEKDVADSKSEDNDKVPVLKISLKDCKQVLSQVDEKENKNSEESDGDIKEQKSKSKDKSKEKSSSSSSKSSSSSSKHSSKKHSSSSSDKSRSSHKSSSSSRHSSKEGSKDKHSTSSSRSKSDSKSSRSSDRSSSSSSKSREERKSSSDKDKTDKDKSREKSKEDKTKDSQKSQTEKPTDDKASTPSIHKLGKIPKLSDVKKDKPSISIEVRKPDEPKPKTVKTFHSKFRKHGLEEEVKPPPSRAAVLNKKPPSIVPPPSVPIPKRPSPVHNETPPEKKIKIIEPVEKPGAIKLIKPKPMMLLESDMFMDALNASATNKKEPKKRKRRTSGSKDGNAPSEGSPPHTPTLTSPGSESKSVPPRFYQDTLETEEDKEKSEKNSDSTENAEPDADKADENAEPPVPHTLTVNGLKGVLCYHKKKGPKRSIRWKPDSELAEIQYFELDETERVNVTKNFTDMKHLDRIKEREAFQMSRNLSSDDVMEEKVSWKPLIPVDVEGQIKVDYGKNSKERDIQAIRQKGTLQPLYFNKAMIPDSALEPEPETHPYSEPANIPLEDVTGNQDNISDFRNMPWPEPKGNAPPVTNLTMPAMFPNNMMPVPNGFPNPQFPGVQMVPGFQGPNMVPGGEWQNGMPPQMMNPMTPGVLAPGAMPPGGMPPGMMMPNDNMMMGPEMFGGPPNPMFPMPPDGFNMPQNMFPMDFNMAGPQGPPGPDNFNGPGNFRGAMRGRGAGGHWRGKAPGGWDNARGRGGARGARKTVCIYFQRKGSCRQGENCSFLHPGVNGPF